MNNDYGTDTRDFMPERGGLYNTQLDQLYAIAKEMEQRLGPVMHMAEPKNEKEDVATTPLARELSNVVLRFEEILSRISL